MKVEFIHSTPGIGYSWLAGQVIEVDGKSLTQELAKQFIDDGIAISVEPETATEGNEEETTEEAGEGPRLENNSNELQDSKTNRRFNKSK